MVDTRNRQMFILSIDGNDVRIFDIPQSSSPLTANQHNQNVHVSTCTSLPITQTLPHPTFVSNHINNNIPPPISSIPINVPTSIPSLPPVNVQQNLYFNQLADAIQRLSDVQPTTIPTTTPLQIPLVCSQPTYQNTNTVPLHISDIPNVPIIQNQQQMQQPQSQPPNLMESKHNIKDNHRDKRIQCGLCNKTFSRRYNLKVHIKTHLKVQPFQCPTCNKQFTQKHRYLLAHHQCINDLLCNVFVCTLKFGRSSKNSFGREAI